MSRGYMLTAFTGLVLVSCGPSAPEPPPPPKSSVCEVKAPQAFRSGGTAEGSIVMSNDGNWCWGIMTAIHFRTPTAPLYAIVTPPQNGEILTTRLNETTRLGYRPNPGFVGTDRFTVRDTPINFDRTFTVTVEPKK